MTRLVVSLVLLAAWLGAATLAAAVVAPGAFAVLPTRALAGALVGQVLPPLFIAGVVVGVMAAALQCAVAGGGRGLRTALPVVIALTCAAAQFGVGPRIARVRAEIGPSVEVLAPGDPKRREFGRLHGVSVVLLGLAAVAATAAIAMTGLGLRARG